MPHSTDLDEVEAFDDETEEVEAPTAEKTAKAAPKAPKRGDLPAGWATPVMLAHELTRLGLGGKNEEGAHLIVPPQVVYSYIKNAPKAHPFPNTEDGVLQTVKDSNGNDRPAFLLEEGVEWWEAKIKRAKERKANAAQKTAKKTEPKAEAVDEAESFEETED
jgi:hypothetical protein